MNLFREDILVLGQDVRPLRSMAEELRAAMEEPEQFRMRYQPIFRSKDKSIETAKALLRWKSPIMGDVSPGKYIAVAEQNGLIRNLTQMVLRKVCEDLSVHPKLVVNANISPLDIVDPAFPDEVASLLAEFGVGKHQIILESTEEVLPEDAGIAAQNVGRLRANGYAIAIYEAGGDPASFGFLRMPEYTLLKIEKKLLDEAIKDPVCRADLKDIIKTSEQKGLKTLAVGVENEDQAMLAEEVGFGFQQGFYHSRSLTSAEVVAFSYPEKENSI